MTAVDLTSLDNVKGWLGLTDASMTEDDALLSRLITAASAFIRSYTNREITSQTYIETRDGTGGNRLMFKNTPVISVSSLLINGQPIPPGDPVSAPGYFFSQTMLMLNGYGFGRGLGNVVISYAAGLADVPSDLEQACIELVGMRFREKDRIGMASKAMAGETTSFITKDMPSSVATVLNQYKRVVPL